MKRHPVATACVVLISMQLSVAGAQSIAPSAVNEKSPVLQPLSGTLFFSQRERATMDRLRKTGAVSLDDIAEQSRPSVLNGFVKRSDGQSTIWVDGQPRFNLASGAIQPLQPQDVGNIHESIKVRLSSADARTIPLAAKKVVKRPTVIKTIKPVHKK